MHRLTGELRGVHPQLIRGEGAGGDGWAGILGQCNGTMCAKAGQRNMLPPESQAKEEDVYSIQCLCGPLCRRGVRDIWARACNTRLSARVPTPNATLLPPPHQGSVGMLPPPGSPCWLLQMFRVSDNCVTDVAFDQITRVRLHVCLQKRQPPHSLVHSLIHSLTMSTRPWALC